MPSLPVRDLVNAAVCCEEAGIDTVWVPDEGFARDVYVTLAAVLGATGRLRAGPGITNPFTRHPSATAAAIASLQEYSDGRCFLGIGAGGSATLGPAGLDRDRPLLRVQELITALRLLFSGDVVSYEGHTLRLVKARLATGAMPVEIWLAGRGPRMLQLAGRAADGVYLSGLPDFSVAQHIANIRRTAAACGRTPGVALAHYVATDRKLFEQARVYSTFSILDSPADVHARIGLTEERVRAARMAMQSEGLAAASRYISDEMLHPFVLAGSADECAEKITSWVRQLQLSEFVFLYGAGVALIPWVEQMGRIATTVRKRLGS